MTQDAEPAGFKEWWTTHPKPVWFEALHESIARIAWIAARATPPEGSAGDVRALREALVIARGWMLDHEYAGVDSLLIGVMHAGDLAIVDRALAATEDRAPAEGGRHDHT